MAAALHNPSTLPVLQGLVAYMILCAISWAQVPPPPPVPLGSDPSRVARKLAETREKLNRTHAVNATAQRAVQYSRLYVDRASKALRLGKPFVADRLLAAADALSHIADHQQHLRGGNGPKPPPGDIGDHLQRVYFRTRQAPYFLQQADDPEAKPFPKWARDFYQLATRAYERHDFVAADENAKCADEVVTALENLAQAASPARVPEPPPPPPPGGPRP